MYSSRDHAVLQPHRGHGAVVRASVCKQHWIFDEHTQTPEDEGREQVEVDVVACAEQLPERNIEKTEMDENISQVQSFIHQFDRNISS